MMDVADALAGAHDYIDEHGWTRRSIHGKDGEVCAFGGILEALGVNINVTPWQGAPEYPLIKECAAALNEVTGYRMEHPPHQEHEVFTLTCWNDTVPQDVQEVLDTFAKAEKIERAGFDPDA